MRGNGAEQADRGCWGGSAGPGAAVGLATWGGLRTGDLGKGLGSRGLRGAGSGPVLPAGSPALLQ